MAELVEQNGLSGLSGAPLFCGEYKHLLDDKKRLTIPAYWREMVGNPQVLYVYKAFNGSFLKVLPARVASERMKLASAKLSEDEREAVQAIVGGRSGLFEWDSNGRVRVSDDMLKHAGITAELGWKVGLKGTMDGFQIWNQDDCPFDEKLARSPDAIKAAMRAMGI